MGRLNGILGRYIDFRQRSLLLGFCFSFFGHLGYYSLNLIRKGVNVGKKGDILILEANKLRQGIKN